MRSKVLGFCLLVICVQLALAKHEPLELMETFLTYAAQESIVNTQTCVANGLGDGMFTPPGAARAYRSVARAMYTAYTFYDADATPDCGSLASVPKHKCAARGTCSQKAQRNAVLRAAYQVIKFLLPERTEMMNLRKHLRLAYGIDVEKVSKYPASTKMAYECVIEDMMTDGSNQQNCYVDYANTLPVNPPTVLDTRETVLEARENNIGKYKWSPLIRTGFIDEARNYFMPHAARMRTFAWDDSFKVPPLLETRGAEDLLSIENEFLELYEYGSRLEDDNSKGKLEAEYWADGPKSTLPPGHWMEITIDILKQQPGDVGNSVKALYLVGNAVYDAGIASWAVKAYFKSVRPATYMTSLLETGLDTTVAQQYKGAYCPLGEIKAWQWQPYQSNTFVTPPFPEYVSGHSAFSASAAEVLKRWFGTDVVPGGPVEVEIKKGKSLFEYQCFENGVDMYGDPCEYQVCESDPAFNSANNFSPKEDAILGPWTTFTEMADAAGVSRLWGGIHIARGNIEGLKLGAAVGRKVWEKSMKLFTGIDMVVCEECEKCDCDITEDDVPAFGNNIYNDCNVTINIFQQ